MGSTVTSQKTKIVYENLWRTLGPELNVLLKTPLQEIAKVGGEKVAEGVGRVRRGQININPGFDGEYGIVKIWGEEKEDKTDQLGLDF